MNLITKISKLTDENDHTGSVKVLAEAMEEKKTVKILESIEAIHRIEGSMNHNLGLYRLDILHGLLERAKGYFGLEMTTKIQEAF